MSNAKMIDFAALRAAILRVWPETILETLPDEEVSALKGQHPGIPEGYLAFLRQVGWGGLGPDAFMVYSGPIAPEDIFGPAPALAGVWLIGDDLAGWCLGLDANAGWRMVGVDRPNREPTPETSPDIASFIADRLAAEADA